jgi:AraC-like DNA-binding protein
VGYLRIGQALACEPDPKALASFLKQLSTKRGIYNTAALSEAYSEIPVVPPNRFNGIVGLANAFADQLTEHTNRLMLMRRREEPAAVTKTRRFIIEHLGEALQLEVLAKNSGVSQFYLCKIFKVATGMTLTEFIGRLRIEWAKQLLLQRSLSVSEIGLDVGFNSLSQFNRLFSRYVGRCPTVFRNEASGALNATEVERQSTWPIAEYTGSQLDRPIDTCAG